MTPRRPSLFVFGAVVALALGGCTEEVQSGTSEEGAEAVEEGTVRERDAGQREDEPYSTHLYSERDADVYSRLGRAGSDGGVPVDTILARMGDRVEAGEVLARLEDEEARLGVEAARPPYRAAAAEHERLEQLHERDAASAAEVEQARFDRERKKAALDRAQLTLERTRVRTPFDGVVSRRYVQVGRRVTQNTPLFRVTALAPLRARILVPEGRMGGLRVGKTLTVRGVDGDTASAHVVAVGPTIDPGSGTREVIVELVDSRGFEPGASVVVEPRVGADERDESGRASARPTEGTGGPGKGGP